MALWRVPVDGLPLPSENTDIRAGQGPPLPPAPPPPPPPPPLLAARPSPAAFASASASAAIHEGLDLLIGGSDCCSAGRRARCSSRQLSMALRRHSRAMSTRLRQQPRRRDRSAPGGSPSSDARPLFLRAAWAAAAIGGQAPTDSKQRPFARRPLQGRIFGSSRHALTWAYSSFVALNTSRCQSPQAVCPSKADQLKVGGFLSSCRDYWRRHVDSRSAAAVRGAPHGGRRGHPHTTGCRPRRSFFVTAKSS